MKIFIVYYSRTGNTELVARRLANVLKCDTEKILDLKNRSGITGWIVGGRDGMNKKMTIIGKMKTDPSNYDLVILGTPIWVNCTPAMRTYLTKHKGHFKNVAFFCTMGGSDPTKLFEELERLTQKKPVATLAVTSDQVRKDTYTDMVDTFIKKIT